MRKLVYILGLLFIASCSTDTDVLTDELLDNEATNDETTSDGQNNAPRIEATAFQIPEHSLGGTAIGTVTASDADEDRLTFTIDSNYDLVIDENTGELSVGENLQLDFETNDEIPFTVSVFDGNTIVDWDATLTITDINEYQVLSQAQKDLVEYYTFLTLRKSASSPRTTNLKWGESIKLYQDGPITPAYREMVTTALAEINDYFTVGDFTISLTNNQSDANATLYLGDVSEIETLWPDIFDIANGSNNQGYASTSFSNNLIDDARIWLSIDSEILFKHELGHGLGLGHSNRCGSSEPVGSFMCSTVSPNHNILPSEVEVLRYLYHEDMPSGLNEQEIEDYLSNFILLDM